MPVTKHKTTAKDIVKALEKKHIDDIGFTEMQFRSGRRIDYWAMPRSWSPLRTYGYEIKVNRRDFVQDEKWPDYLKSVHYLYFACPWGLIKPDEIPKGVGLIYLGKNGTRLTTKQKPVRNDVTDHEVMTCTTRGLWRHNPHEVKETRTERIARYKQRIEDAKTGQEIAGLLNYKYMSRMLALEREAEKHASELVRLNKVLEFCKKHEIPLDREWAFADKLREYERTFSNTLGHDEYLKLKKIKKACETLLDLQD